MNALSNELKFQDGDGERGRIKIDNFVSFHFLLPIIAQPFTIPKSKSAQVSNYSTMTPWPKCGISISPYFNMSHPPKDSPIDQASRRSCRNVKVNGVQGGECCEIMMPIQEKIWAKFPSTNCQRRRPPAI